MWFGYFVVLQNVLGEDSGCRAHLDSRTIMPDGARMLARLGNAFLILALLAATGMHWAMLQSAAWAAMLANNLRAASVVEAVERTFDGKHPCSLCKQIAASQKSGKKAQFPLLLKKFEFLTAKPRFIFAAPTHSWRLVAADAFPRSVGRTPPTPPPRGTFV